jgi:hypothetical protein
MKRRKCEIIPVSQYDGGLAILFEDNTHKYHKGAKGHYLKITRKTCSICASTAVYVAIFKYPRHNRVERFCKEHAAQFTNAKELPPIPEVTCKLREAIII